MYKTELVKAVADKTGLSVKEATKATTAVFEAIMNAVKEGQDVTIPGFGSFGTKTVAARAGEFRGVKYETKAHKAPSFKPGATFRNSL